MANQGKTTLQFPQKTAPYDANDVLVFVYGADTSNTSNAVAQTATISIQNFFSSNIVANSTIITTQQADPANSHAWVGPQGSIFFSNSYGYVAIAANTLMRFTLNSF